MVSRINILLLLLAAVLLPGRVMALTLGEPDLLSTLQQPLRVQVALFDWQGIDLNGLKVSLASREEFEGWGVDYQPWMDGLKFSVLSLPNTDPEILMSTRDSMSDPFVDLVLSLQWPGGSMLQEFILLLDPQDASP